ncbi:MAG: PIN domain-containing protein [Candidatus Methylacidiphilales bacterium]
MAKIYIDTCTLLDFYRSATNRLDVFDEIEKRSAVIVFTEQTIHEFRRSRVSCLNKLIDEMSKPSLFVATTAIVSTFPEHADLIRLQKEAFNFRKVICNKMKEWLEDEFNDPVHKQIAKLTQGPNLYPTFPDAISRAQTRKLLGNPPVSPDKHTIGDELIWETLLKVCEDDLIIVTNDNTYRDNIAFLKHEYFQKTNHKLLAVTASLNEALKKIGSDSEKIAIAEKEILIKSARYPFPLTLESKCPSCGGELEETGYEGGEGDEAWWVYCLQCGKEHFPSEFEKAQATPPHPGS